MIDLFAIFPFIFAAALNVKDSPRFFVCLIMVLALTINFYVDIKDQLFFLACIVSCGIIAISVVFISDQAWAFLYGIILTSLAIVNLGGIINFDYGYDDYIWMYDWSVIIITIMEFLVLVAASTGRLDFHVRDYNRSRGFIRARVDHRSRNVQPRNDHPVIIGQT